MSFKEDYDPIIEGTGLKHYYDAHAGCLEVSVPSGVVVISSPRAGNALVGEGVEGVSGHWLLSLETPLGEFIEPQQAARTAEYARALLLEWAARKPAENQDLYDEQIIVREGA
jgi:hypothetical protein